MGRRVAPLRRRGRDTPEDLERCRTAQGSPTEEAPGEAATRRPARRSNRPKPRNRAADPEIRTRREAGRPDAPTLLHSRAMKFDYPHTLDKEEARSR